MQWLPWLLHGARVGSRIQDVHEMPTHEERVRERGREREKERDRVIIVFINKEKYKSIKTV